MSTAQTEEPVSAPTTATVARKPLRLWPGVAAAALIVVAWFIVPFLFPKAILYGMLGGVAGMLVVAVWWLLFSRARWFDRLAAILLIALALFATYPVIYISLQNGAMGFLFYFLAVPVSCVALVIWAVVTRRLSDGVRRAALVGTVLLVCVGFTLLRTGGMT